MTSVTSSGIMSNYWSIDDRSSAKIAVQVGVDLIDLL
jgi:hypothetical protein